MSEHATLNRGTVAERCLDVKDPESGKNVVQLGWMRNIGIFSGAVVFELQHPRPDSEEAARLREACLERVRTIPGVKRATARIVPLEEPAPKKQETAKEPAASKPAQGLRGVRHVIGVASGKGGVGKSTASVNIAMALSQQGYRVGLMDADIYGPSAPTMLRIEEPPTQAGPESIKPARASGIFVISMAFFMQPGQAAILRGPIVSGTILQFLNNVDWGDLDYLIIDYPPGTGDIQLTLSQQAPLGGAVVVTTPQEISLVDVERALKMFETTKVPVLGIAEQMSYFICDNCEKRHHIFRNGGGRAIAEKTGVPFLGEVPIDPRVAVYSDRGTPVVTADPESPVAKAYVEIAQALAAQMEIIARERENCLDEFRLQWDRQKGSTQS